MTTTTDDTPTTDGALGAAEAEAQNEAAAQAMAEAIEAELMAQLPAELRGTGDRFVIDSEEKARWFVNKLRGKDEEIARIKKESEEWLRVLKNERDRFARRFVPELEEWARAQLGENPKTKTVRTLAGKLTFKDTSMSVVCVDREKATAWAIQNRPEWVKTTHDLADLTAVKKALQPVAGPDGEVTVPELPPGFAIEEPQRVFGIEGVKL